jgi:hypothetical protein
MNKKTAFIVVVKPLKNMVMQGGNNGINAMVVVSSL